MDKLISVGFQLCAAGVVLLACPAVEATAVLPGVFDAPVADIAFGIIKQGAHRIFAVGALGAVQGAAGHQGGELGDGNAKKLVFHDMVNPFLLVGNLLFQTLVQAFGDFAQKHAALTGRVQKASVGVAPETWGQQVEHAVR